jgi:hypothetical protein
MAPQIMGCRNAFAAKANARDPDRGRTGERRAAGKRACVSRLLIHRRAVPQVTALRSGAARQQEQTRCGFDRMDPQALGFI